MAGRRPRTDAAPAGGAPAVWRDRQLVVTYRPLFAVDVALAVDPYGLVVKAGIWYLVYALQGRVNARRLTEFRDVRETGATFERPDGFSLEAFWKAWCAENLERREQFRVRVRGRRARASGCSTTPGRAPSHWPTPDLSMQGWFPPDLAFETIEEARLL